MFGALSFTLTLHTLFQAVFEWTSALWKNGLGRAAAIAGVDTINQKEKSPEL